MVQKPEESLWIHGDEPEDIFPLQGIFGLHPLSVEAVTHQNQLQRLKSMMIIYLQLLMESDMMKWRLANSKSISRMNERNTTLIS
jgi:hypothetical protein